jgi:hypothetical protein
VRGVDLALSGDRLLLSRTFQVNGSPAGAGSVVADLPLRVHGTITPQRKAPVPVSFVLGNGRPLTRTLISEWPPLSKPLVVSLRVGPV